MRNLKKNNLYRISLLFAFMFLMLSYVNNNPPGVTNAPGETSCATNALCHVGPVNSGAGFGEITVMGGIPANGYVPDQSYTLMPFVMDSVFVTRGFQTLALLSNNSAAGSVLITDPVKTQLISSGGKEYVTQTDTGSQNPGMHDWMYEWTAPPSGSGAVTIYGAFVAADGSGDASGDRVYTDSLVLEEDLSAGWFEPFGGGSTYFGAILPNPTNDFIHIPVKGDMQALPRVLVYSFDGRLSERVTPTASLSSNEKITLDVSMLKPGIYFITLKIDEQQTWSSRFCVVK